MIIQRNIYPKNCISVSNNIIFYNYILRFSFYLDSNYNIHFSDGKEDSHNFETSKIQNVYDNNCPIVKSDDKLEEKLQNLYYHNSSLSGMILIFKYIYYTNNGLIEFLND
jgi:hypothetical protein